MADCTTCPFCPGATIREASQRARVPAVVRAFRDERFTVWRCPSCDSLHSLESVDLDAYYRAYPLARQSEGYLSRKFCERRLKALEREGISKDSSVLDFGCGTGLFVAYMRSRGYADVSGHDPYIADFRSPEALAHRYDAVLAQDVIEHAEDPEGMLAQLVRCLKPGGLLFLGTPCAERIDLDRPEAFAVSLHQPYHRHIFSTRALLELAARQGLRPSRMLDRHVGESAAPGANVLFLHEFIRRSGGVIDAAFEPPRKDLFRSHPRLLLLAAFGYFFSRKSEMAISFRWQADGELAEAGRAGIRTREYGRASEALPEAASYDR
jgi:SAM-dependent methyltransferase